MLAYILDNTNLTIKDILEFETYDFREDIEYSEKSSIVVARKPDVKDDDFIYCKDGNDKVFIGICENFKSTGDTSEYTISMLQKEKMFDRNIFVEEEELIFLTGIEDFIAKAIQDNFVSSGDTLMDKTYITVVAATHTPIAAKVDAENGVYNLKTYLGNAKQYYGIFVEFNFAEHQLIINIVNRDEAEIPIDANVTDISDYKETCEVSVLARLWVKWKIPDTEDENGNAVIGETVRRQFYLLSDRTITEDVGDEERTAGIARSIFIESETENEMLQSVYNEFSSNRYNHKLSFGLNRESKLYPPGKFFVGRKCTIKTKSGIRASMVTKSECSSESTMVALTFGNLKVTLIEKLRR